MVIYSGHKYCPFSFKYLPLYWYACLLQLTVRQIAYTFVCTQQRVYLRALIQQGLPFLSLAKLSPYWYRPSWLRVIEHWWDYVRFNWKLILLSRPRSKLFNKERKNCKFICGNTMDGAPFIHLNGGLLIHFLFRFWVHYLEICFAKHLSGKLSS